MLNIKLQVPLTNPGSWGDRNSKGQLEVSGDFDSNLIDEYGNLKKELNSLLDAASSELKLVENLVEIEELLQRKQSDLRYIEGKISTAKKQLDRVAGFLRRLGIDPSTYYLIINEEILTEPTTTLEPLALESSSDFDDDDDGGDN